MTTWKTAPNLIEWSTERTGLGLAFGVTLIAAVIGSLGCLYLAHDVTQVWSTGIASMWDRKVQIAYLCCYAVVVLSLSSMGSIFLTGLHREINDWREARRQERCEDQDWSGDTLSDASWTPAHAA
jgi:hypothetical protein